VEVENLSAKALAQEREKQEFLAAQKEKLEMEVQHRTAALRKSLSDLKAAQVQLVHSEKMASLGELTAGIAHEIQNPLNFINNFSEVGVELLDEAQAGISNGRKEVSAGALQAAKDNLQKVIYHGKRADAIVKGMLQHARRSTGVKEPTDLNALAGEYLRLSYHGLRAKDKTFSATIETHFDEGIDNVPVVPQEIGRVLLNLYSNAFYSVIEKKKRLDGRYEPKVSVSTRKAEGTVEIIVSDNGTGIPEKTVDKIFQPFFTTKPTGEGTGLGLSLSYDIVTKGHGGTLEVETKEGEGSNFIIRLPLDG
jgi:signal transduction histidine kinase